MSRPTSSLGWYFHQKDLFNDLVSLEIEAGISIEMAKARDGTLYFPSSLDMESGSPEAKEADKFDRQYEDQICRARTRSLYFGVAPLELRRALIARHRSIWEASREEILAEVREAEASLSDAQMVGSRWSVVAAMGAVVFVSLGWMWFYIPGAIAGAVIAIFAGREFERDAVQRRAKATAAAETDLRLCRESRDFFLARNSAYFSQGEAETGQRDHPDR